MWPDLTLSSHDVVIFPIWEDCYFGGLFGVIHTPRIQEACEVGGVGGDPFYTAL